jgi:hypothetical protein
MEIAVICSENHTNPYVCKVLSFLILQQVVHLVASWFQMANPHAAITVVYGIHLRLL